MSSQLWETQEGAMINWERVEELLNEVGPEDFEEVIELF